MMGLRIGLGIGLGGGGSSSPPSLVLDFVGTSPATLSINLTAEPLGSCVAFQTDASQPQAGFAFFQVRE